MQSNFEPKPSGRGTKFYLHLSNWAEFLSWMSAGMAIAFLVQLAPKLLLVYPIVFVLTLAYFASNIPHNQTASFLRIVAIVCSLIGFWNLVWLYRDTVSAVAIAIVLVMIAGRLFAMAESEIKVTYRELAFGSFAAGVIGLCISIPGYVKDWREYKICNEYFGITSCQNRAYSFENPTQPRTKPTTVYFGEPLTKVLGIAIACVSFPLTAYAAREMAEISEYNETVCAIEKTAELQSLISQRETDLKLGAEVYEAMKSIEYADAIDRFRESFYISIDAEDVDAEIESRREHLSQAENRKALEFNVEAVESIAQTQPGKPQISENAQKILNYLTRKEVSKDKPMSVNTVQKNGVIKNTMAPVIRELFAELVRTGLATLDDDGSIYLINDDKKQ